MDKESTSTTHNSKETEPDSNAHYSEASQSDGTADIKEAVNKPQGVKGNIESEDNLEREDNLELHSMSFKERIKAKQNKLKRNMEGMSPKEKSFYILSYYKWQIITAIVVIVCAIALPVTIYRNTRPVAIAYVIVNCDAPEIINENFVDDYREFFGLQGNYQVRSDTSIHLDKDTYLEEFAQNRNDSVYTEFPMMCFNGFYDIIITDDVGAIYCGMQEIMCPLRNYLPADLYSQIEDRIFETENHDGDVVPFAIDISDTEFAKNLNLGYDKVYIGFPGTTEENYVNAKRMLKYILGVETDE